VDAGCVDDAADNRREALDDLRVIGEERLNQRTLAAFVRFGGSRRTVTGQASTPVIA